MRRVWLPALVLGATLGFGAAALLLNRQQATQVATSRPDPDSTAETVALETLRNRQRNTAAVAFREVRVWRYGPPDERAVCGVMTSPELPSGSAPFVMRVVLPQSIVPGPSDRPRPRSIMTVLEDGPGLARPSPAASRRFCHDGDPPLPAEPQIAAAPPEPRPREMPVSPDGPAPAESGPTEDSGVTRDQVMVASPANLRSGPGGSWPVLSVVPRGQILTVFDRAPGGWLQVGGQEPWGWIHGSLLAEALSSR